MAVKIQSNYTYTGNDFLDSRHSEAKSLDDLKNWFKKENSEDIIIIPEGFEVWAEGNWYTYNPELGENEITGYFYPRLTEEKAKNLLPNGLIKVGNILGTVEII